MIARNKQKKQKKHGSHSSIGQNDGANDDSSHNGSKNISHENDNKNENEEINDNDENDDDSDLSDLDIDIQTLGKNRDNKNDKKSNNGDLTDILKNIDKELKFNFTELLMDEKFDALTKNNNKRTKNDSMELQDHNDLPSRMIDNLFANENENKNDNNESKGDFETGERLARLVSKCRDSTYTANYCNIHRFIKIGETSQTEKEIIENIKYVLNIGPQMFPNGGLDNIMRISLHLNNSMIQLPFYHNTQANPCYTLVTDENLHVWLKTKWNGKYARKKEILKRRKERENQIVKRLGQHLKMKTKILMQGTVPIENLTKSPQLSQCHLPKHQSAVLL